MENIEIEKKVKLLILLKDNRLSYRSAAKEAGLKFNTVGVIKGQADRIEKNVKEYAKLFDGGLPYLMWPELISVKKNEHETEADLRKQIKYLEAKVAYYEELSKLEGIDLSRSLKKNDVRQSKPSLKEESEQ